MAILMVPASDGPGVWQRCWLAEREDAVLVPADDPGRPGRAGALARLATVVCRNPGAILVGQGVGVHLIAHLAAERPDLPVGAALLVGPVDVDAGVPAGPGAAALAPTPVRPFAFPSLLVASRNDPALSFDKARVLANLWEAALVDLGRAGAISRDEGAATWSTGRDLLARLEQVLRPPVRLSGAYRAGRPAA